VCRYEELGISQLHLPVVDYTSPSLLQLEQAVSFVESFLSRSETVYIHCKGGKGRSATVVLAFFIKHYKLSRHDALRRLKSRRPQVSTYIFRRPPLIEFEERIRTAS
jgi:atypical dual specificity phosphatase